MMTTTGQEIRFFKNLGKLFYAIAASDKNIHESEIKALKKIVRSKWTIENDLQMEYQTNLDHQIEFEFDWLSKNKIDITECFNEFITFKENHEDLFTMNIKKLIWETANVIAIAFSGKNKSEVIMLTKLKLNLQK